MNRFQESQNEKSQLKTILINEDDGSLSEILREEFEELDFQVYSTTRTLAAIEIFNAKSIDFVLTDYCLPGEDGHILVTHIINLGKFIPIALMSGYQRVTSDLCMFWSKPLNPRDLANFVAKNLRSLSDIQTLRMISHKTGFKLDNIGVVAAYYPEKGWGLLKVIGMERLLYFNAADINGQNRFFVLYPGQVLRFDVNENSLRGPRAINIEVIFDGL